MDIVRISLLIGDGSVNIVVWCFFLKDVISLLRDHNNCVFLRNFIYLVCFFSPYIRTLPPRTRFSPKTLANHHCDRALSDVACSA